MHEPIGERQLHIMEHGLAAKGPIVMDYDKLKEVEEKLAADKENYKLWAARGILYFNEDFEKAIESFSEAIALEPFNSDMYYNRGRKFLSQDRYIQALSDFSLSVRIDPNDAWKWHFQGMAYFLLGRYSLAIDSFSKGIDLHVKNKTNNIPPEVDWIWTSYMKMGDYESAQECLKMVDKDTPVERGDLMYKKRVLLYKGEMTLEEFEAQMELDNDKRAITELYGAAAYCYYIKKDTKRALEFLDMIFERKSSLHAFGYKLALLDKVEWSK